MDAEMIETALEGIEYEIRGIREALEPEPAQPLKCGYWYIDTEGDTMKYIGKARDTHKFYDNENDYTFVLYPEHVEDKNNNIKPATLDDLAVEIDGGDMNKVKCWFVRNADSEMRLYQKDSKGEYVWRWQQCYQDTIKVLDILAKHEKACVIRWAQWRELTKGE